MLVVFQSFRSLYHFPFSLLAVMSISVWRILGEIRVIFKGHTLNCRRNINEHSFDSMGDDIIIQHGNITKSFLVEIAQRQFVEEDPTNECLNYPNQEYYNSLTGCCRERFPCLPHSYPMALILCVG